MPNKWTYRTDTEKECSKCSEIKPITREFWHFSNKTNRPGNSICKVCRAAYAAAKYPENKEKMRAKARIYVKANRHKQAEYHARYKAKDTEAYLAKRRVNAARYRATVKGGLSNRMQTAIWHGLRRDGLRKNDHLFKILGWTIDELKDHLEERFEEGMSWDNMKAWHIDHVMPQSLVQIDSVECDDFKTIWALDNLAPLWANDNQTKYNDYLWQLPATYKNPKLRSMYPAPLDLVGFFNVNTKALKDMGYEAIAFGSATESQDSIANGAFHRL